MLKCIVRNETGFELQLTHNENMFKVTNISGLEPPKMAIYSSNVYTLAGEVFNYAKDEKRNIVIEMYLVNDVAYDIHQLVTAFKTSQKITLIFDDTFMIDGYVETLEYNEFDEQVACQVSVMCLYPYFLSANTQSDSFLGLESLFEFPFSLPQQGKSFGNLRENPNTEITVNNTGMQTGCRIELYFNDNATNIEFKNITNNSELIIHRDFWLGETLIVDFTGVNKIVMLNGKNIIGDVLPTNNFLYLSSGTNRITYKVEQGLNYNNIDITYNTCYTYVDTMSERDII